MDRDDQRRWEAIAEAHQAIRMVSVRVLVDVELWVDEGALVEVVLHTEDGEVLSVAGAEAPQFDDPDLSCADALVVSNEPRRTGTRGPGPAPWGDLVGASTFIAWLLVGLAGTIEGLYLPYRPAGAPPERDHDVLVLETVGSSLEWTVLRPVPRT